MTQIKIRSIDELDPLEKLCLTDCSGCEACHVVEEVTQS